MPKDVIDQKDPPCAGEGRVKDEGIQPEEAAGRRALPPWPPYQPGLAGPSTETRDGWFLFCQPIPGALKCENKQKLRFSRSRK